MKNNTIDNEDIEIDDIIKNLAQKKKKINSGRKGKSGEREIVKILNSRFEKYLSSQPNSGSFSRSVGSGNRWSQAANMPKHAQDTFTGDLVCPENFKYVLECKTGYNDVDLISCFSNKCAELDAFLKQVTDDSIRSKRLPMLIWKKNRKELVCFIKQTNIDLSKIENQNRLFYKDWVCLSFEFLLSFEDNFFFN